MLGIRRERGTHTNSHSKPRPPFSRVREWPPKALATLGRNIMAPAEPRYIPDVVSETALALSVGGMHCRGMERIEPPVANKSLKI